MKTTLLPLAALTLTVALAPLAHAQIPFETFTASGPGTTSAVAQTDPASYQFNYSDRSTNVYGGETWTFLALSDFTGVRTIDFSGTGYHAYYQATADVTAFDPTSTQTLFSGGASGGFSYSGEITLNVVAGQDYGFTISGQNADSDDILTGQLNLTDVTAVPEPSTWAMLAGGAGLLLVGQRLRRSQAA